MIFKRYNDKNNLVTDVNELQLSATAEVVIYREDEWYGDVLFDLEGKKERFKELKSFIVFVAENLCELDCMAQKYSALHGDDRFADGYAVAYICFHEPDRISLTYYGTYENTEFDVVFQYNNDGFILKSFGMIKDIGADWNQ
ncbi:MAG: hypothetical protein K2G55_07065 [Lachnospiraceae bacterium]|nr:hypothetical protein [Lachnospiraceae bacterium]MDE7202509.1 hypothetical protein [Lachnospiraceae bacterium]